MSIVGPGIGQDSIDRELGVKQIFQGIEKSLFYRILFRTTIRKSKHVSLFGAAKYGPVNDRYVRSNGDLEKIPNVRHKDSRFRSSFSFTKTPCSSRKGRLYWKQPLGVGQILSLRESPEPDQDNACEGKRKKRIELFPPIQAFENYNFLIN